MKKTVILIMVLVLNHSLFAQWANNEDRFNLKDPSKSVPIIIMFSGFTYNEVILNQPKFENYSTKKMNQTMLTGYLLTATLSIGSHLIIKGIQNKKHHRRFFYH